MRMEKGKYNFLKSDLELGEELEMQLGKRLISTYMFEN